ncbi:membrane-spanning 4-domains subfamily A member 8-like [Nycticebus coucang]|uniref:membrane-spanning 4-domains subfamily A member 8-like n=1 Tax=Nycticebus coucang TaxID=9470 RepID=UPI00234CB52F|nr:membrane-spanning 4-domains subfamily A member 8-like [Nycticebus coucang]XP_053418829.1 membrane-spanning 4-domains subfamily A member 8-like [Nycticebus coucang]
MNPMTSADPTANSMFVAAPQGSYPVAAPSSSYPVIPQVVSPVPLYPNNQPQVHLIPGNPPGLESNVNVQPAQKGLKEGKSLGAIQILIGLIHLGLSSVLATTLYGEYLAVSFYGGFLFWGGIWFIVSGSLSVATERQPNSSCLLNASVGLNIVSAICAAVGVILFIVDLSINSSYPHPNYYPYNTWGLAPGLMTSGVLLVFCLLELGISSAAAHFGCQMVCCPRNTVSTVYPNVYTTSTAFIPEPPNMPSPPRYSSEIQAPHKQS